MIEVINMRIKRTVESRPMVHFSNDLSVCIRKLSGLIVTVGLLVLYSLYRLILCPYTLDTMNSENLVHALKNNGHVNLRHKKHTYISKGYNNFVH